MQTRIIKGAKGGKGGGGGSSAVEADDSLRSDAYVSITDLLGEGEWQGLVDGNKSIYINGGTRLQNDDGSYNFTVERIETRNGTQSQNPLSDFFANAENPISVGTEVRIDTGAVIRTISGDDVDKVRVIVTVPQLTTTDNTNGNINGGAVTFGIDVQSDGGGFVVRKVDTISGKKTGSYQRQYEIDITGLTKPVDIRLRRITADSDSAFVANKLVWDTYTEIITGKLNYPNSVLVGMRLAAAQFSSIPSRAYHVRMKRIKVPVNYDPTTRIYTGVWNGSFKIAYCNNPAWCFYDMLTNSRYGLGDYIAEAQVDKWALYNIGQYCDELVDDGFGGKEPRFTFNAYFTEQAEAYKVMQDIASAFRGMTFWQAGQISVAQDAPATATRIFTNSNVEDGKFIYSGSSQKTRFTATRVMWNDPTDLYKQKVEWVQDDAGIATYGFRENPSGLTAFGCTSRGMATRLGRWYLTNNLLETETVTFRIGAEGATLKPAQIIKVMDNQRAGAQASGRIRAASYTTITLDWPQVLTPGVNYSLLCMLPDLTVESRTVTGAVGNTLTVANAFSAVPLPQAVWVMSSDVLVPQEFRVVGVAEDQGKYEVTALKYSSAKYAALEQGLVIEPAPITTLTVTPETPGQPTGSESLYADGSQVKVVMTIDWAPARLASYYEITVTPPNGNTITLPQTSLPTVDIRDAEPGMYSFSVRSISAAGKPSPSATGSYKVQGKITPPGDVQGFSMFPVGSNMATFVWDAAVDLDVTIGGAVRVRYSPKIDGTATVGEAVDIGTAIAGSATEAMLPLVTGTYFAQFVDSSGNISLTPAEIITTVPNVLNLNVIDTVMDSPDFIGTAENMAYNETLGGLLIAGATYIDDMPEIDSIDEIDWIGGVCAEGTFTSADTIDLSAVYDVKLTSILQAAVANIGSTIDSRTDLIDDWADIDGAGDNAANAWMEVRTTEDNHAGAPVWTDWRRFVAGDYTFRALQRRIRAVSVDYQTTIYITEAGIRLDLADRVESASNIVSGAAAYTVNYQFPFWTTPPTPGIVLQNAQAGDTFVIDNETAGGFRITFYNSAAMVNRTFGYFVKGQGKRQ